jgi:PAS domain S-box-containing protein
MDNIAYSQILILFFQCFIVAALLLTLFRLRTVFGLGLLFTALGAFQYMQVFLVSSLYIELMPGILVSPGSMVLFTGSLFVILLIYIREDALETRKVIYALVAANLALILLQLVFGWSIDNESVKNIYNLPKEFFTDNALILLLGTLFLFVDAFLLIFIYEAISRIISSLFLRIFFSMVLILCFDSVFFSMIAFLGTEQFENVLISSLLSKISAALIYSVLFTVYLFYFDKTNGKKDAKIDSYKDIFDSLTFRQKYEQVYKEKENQKIDLQKSEEYNRLLFNTSPVGLAVCKMDGTLMDINPAYTNIIGRTIDETLKLSYWDITPEKYADQETLQLKSLDETGSYGPYEKEYIHSAGHLVPVVLNGLIIKQNGEKFIWSSVEDITERKQAGNKLIQIYEQLTDTLERMSDGFVSLDKNWIYTYVNKKAGEMFGRKPEDLVGKHIWTEFPEGINQPFYKTYFKVIETQKQISFVDYYKPWDRWFENHVIPTKEGLAIFFQEITERKKAEIELRKSKDYNRLLFNTSATGLALSKMDGSLVDINLAYSKIIGKTIKETLKLSEWDITPEKYANQDAVQLKSIEETGRYGPYEKEYIHNNGHLVPVVLNGLIVEQDGEKFIWSSVEDITERKLAENELKTYRDVNETNLSLESVNIKLLELDQLKSMFIASMSHELRTPLNSIIGFSGILLMGLAGDLNKEQTKQLTFLKSSASHLLSLITDIIDLSKIEAGKMDFEIEQTDLKEIIVEVIEIVQPLADQKSLKLYTEGFEKSKIKTDGRRIRQVIINLVNNAIKFTDEGKISIIAKKRKNEIIVSVIDEGIGIRKGDQDKLFSAFSQIFSKDSKVIEGTGLGLYLSKKIIEKLKGNIWLKSEFGKGSTFSFSLPMRNNVK